MKVYLYRVEVVNEGPPLLFHDYTGKLVKTLLMVSCPDLTPLFEEGHPSMSKKLHVSPLYVLDALDAKPDPRRAVYPKLAARGCAKPTGKPSPVLIEEEKPYTFFIGAWEGLAQLVEATLYRLGVGVSLQLGGREYVFRAVAWHREVERDISVVERLPQGTDAVDLVLASPTVVTDLAQHGKLKRFFPVAGYLLAVNIAEVLEPRRKLARKAIRLVNTVLVESYASLQSVRLVWYKYDSNVLPALAGRIRYFVDWKLLDKFPGLETVIARAIAHAEVMGVGSGRAAGFGHITVNYLSTHETQKLAENTQAKSL